MDVLGKQGLHKPMNIFELEIAVANEVRLSGCICARWPIKANNATEALPFIKNDVRIAF